MNGEEERDVLAREFDRQRAVEGDILEAIATDNEKHPCLLAMVEKPIP